MIDTFYRPMYVGAHPKALEVSMRRSVRETKGVYVAGAFVVIMACADPRTGPELTTGSPSSGVSEVATEWTKLSADVVISQEVIHGKTGERLSSSPTYRYAVDETKSSLGYRGVITRQPFQAGDISDGLKRLPSGRNLARVEFDAATGLAQVYSADGQPFRRAVPQGLTNRNAPSWYREPPRAPANAGSLAAKSGRRSMIAALVVDQSAGQKLRNSLIDRYGMPTTEDDGDELFAVRSGDTIRTLSFRPAVGAVVSIRVDVGGSLTRTTEYEFGHFGEGVVGRTKVRTMQLASDRGGSDRLISTSVSWSNVRLVR